MLKEEFEKLMGREYDYYSFCELNLANKELGNMETKAFCESLMNNPEWLVRELGWRLNRERGNSNRHRKVLEEIGLFLLNNNTSDAMNAIKENLGMSEYIKVKLKNGINLDKYELKYLLNRL